MLSRLRSIFSTATLPDCDFSVIVVAYDMARELPRTLHSLSRAYQRELGDISYEVVVVDNGSPQAVSETEVIEHGPEFRLLRLDGASPSPAPAINRGAELARGRYLGLIVDGARVLSPGALHWAHQAFRLQPRAVVAVPGFHLGPEHQRLSSQRGYDQAVEDRLLEQVQWPGDGYRLFEIGSLAGSCRFGWHGPLAESNCTFVSRELFDRCEGFDERFQSPGGGLVNLDFYQRACEAANYQVYHLAGEGCFHQIHGGVTTGGAAAEASRFNDLRDEYRSVRGRDFEHHDYRPVLLGTVPDAANPLVAQGLEENIREHALAGANLEHLRQAGLDYPPPESGR